MAYLLEENLLAKARLFAGLERPARARLAQAAHLISRRPGAAFFAQGDPADAFFVLIEGRVRIAQITLEGHQVTVRYIGPGDVFGAVPLFSGGPYPATALAVLDSTAARWSREVAQQLAEEHSIILANALAIVGCRLQEMQDRYRELATERVEQRIARAIINLTQARDGRNPFTDINFPISRQDIAELTGTTLHTVSRILSAWQQRGILESHRMHIRVVSLDDVRAIADDLNRDRNR